MTVVAEEAIRVRDAIRASRNHHLGHLALAVAMSAWFGYRLYMRDSLATGWGIANIAIVALNVFVLIVMARALVRLRTGSPAISALLERPDNVASITGWPAVAKLPAGKYQAYLRVETRSGERAMLHVKPENIASLVDTLHRRSPGATVAVQNVAVHAG